MKNIFYTAMAFALAIGLPTNVKAEENEVPKGYLSVGIGANDAADNEEAADFRIEYRPGHKYWKDLKPWAGAEITSEGSIWGGGGVLYDYEFTPQWYVIPNIGIGAYAQGSSNKDLGGAIELRSQLELAYKLENKDRIGLAFSHISNAGLNNKNPGTEVLNAYYHIGF